MPTTPDVMKFYPADVEVAQLYAVTKDLTSFGLPEGSIVAAIPNMDHADKVTVCFKMDEDFTDPQCNLYRTEIQTLLTSVLVRWNDGRFHLVESAEDGA